MTAHHQYLPACKCPSCQEWWSFLDPHWSSSWGCPSPPPADTHENGTALKGEEKAVWNVLSVPFGPNLPYTRSPVRAVLCRWQDEFQHQPCWSHFPETIVHMVSEEQRSCFCSWATASVTSPSHWARPRFSRRCYWSRRWSANQRQRWKNCGSQANTRGSWTIKHMEKWGTIQYRFKKSVLKHTSRQWDTPLTACCKVERHDARQPTACRGRRCPDALQQAGSPGRRGRAPQRRSSTDHCWRVKKQVLPTEFT